MFSEWVPGTGEDKRYTSAGGRARLRPAGWRASLGSGYTPELRRLQETVLG